MEHMMKKAEFIELLAKCDDARLKTFRGSVYLYNGATIVAEVYCASNMKESGIISAMNQATKYRGWMQA